MIAAFSDIEQAVSIGGLSAAQSDSHNTLFHSGDFFLKAVDRRVGEAGIEKSALFQVEQISNALYIIIFVGGALH